MSVTSHSLHLNLSVMELLELLRNHPGQILLSGYDNTLKDEYLHGWKKDHKNTQAEGGLKRIETSWMNY